jgi:DNA polymerase I-like protein with 3'-5' exonuclease and polymerase domains
MYWDRKEVNKIIPIYKHIESCQEIANKIKYTIESKEFNSCKNNGTMQDYLLNLRKIESAGLYTSSGKTERCKYNPYTLTGRPSNTFNKVNYAALNKSDGTRDKYISRFNNGSILELDYDAYHLRIIADIIGYELPKGSIHQYLGKQYFSKKVLSKKEYEEAKQISFQILYGGIPKEFLSIPFFNKVNEFIFNFWKSWNTKNHFETYLYNRKVSKTVIGEMTPQKLFNYYIQSAETELNSEAMKRVFGVISKYKTRFILYTYDSFTFDFNMDDGKELIVKIKDAMKYPTKVSMGSNYGVLKDVS